MEQTLRALTTSVSGMLDLYSRRLESVSSKLSRGLMSLPDELLAHILSAAVHSIRNRSLCATRLSHVSRRFRRIVLGDQSLWSSLSLNAKTSTELVKRSISHSGKDTDLHISMEYSGDTSTTALHGLLNICSPTSSRWESLSVCGVWDGEDSDTTLGDELLCLMKQRHLVLPRLHELHLNEYFIDSSLDFADGTWISSTANFADIRPWEAPNLRIMRCTQHIPTPSFPFKSFTVFMLSLMLLPGYTPAQVEELVAFLASKPNISEIVLELDGIDFDLDEELDISAVVCPAVTSFQYSIVNVDLDSVQDVYGPILETLRMPKLQSFSLSVELLSFGTHTDDAAFPLLPSLLLPDPSYHPLLSSLIVNVRFPAFIETLISPETRSLMIYIPLYKIPHVSTVYVTTFGQVSFFRRRMGCYATGLSALREVQLISCVNMDVEGLRIAVKSLKDAGAWDMIERVVIKGCDLLDYDAALEAIGRERLRFSKS